MLLAEAAVIDHRVVTEETVSEWLQIVPEDVTVAEARGALLTHRRESSEYLVPAHIVAGVRALRSQGEAPGLAAERAALADFCAYTGISREVAAARWNDHGWRLSAIDRARSEHRLAAGDIRKEIER